MGKRRIIVKHSAAESIAEIAFYIESIGMLSTAERFIDSVYDFIENMADDRKLHRLCRDPKRASFGIKIRFVQ